MSNSPKESGSIKGLKPVDTSATVGAKLGASNFVIPEDDEDNVHSPLDVNDKYAPKKGVSFLARN